ncbi:thiol S-methyltransferase TMT1A-like isoform X2 [Procambarus clarkii]|uniref:thiol S-methyltransferase TMT1A-like isoform X2 n=1 Tax=Procambarus clarkii TaxID=6728 RepID=UPI00374278B5
MSYLVTALCVVVVIWVLKKFWPDLRHRYFASFMNSLTQDSDAKVEEMKKDVFSKLSTVVSHDPELRKHNAIKILEIGVGTAENMDMVADNSIDVVVSTLVLCSVENINKIIQQILRVLAPGGKFYFYEHIKEFDTERHSTRQKIQVFLSSTGIWPFFFDGCYLTRDMLEAIQQAGFSKVQALRFYSPIDNFVFQLVKPSLKGVAEK